MVPKKTLGAVLLVLAACSGSSGSTGEQLLAEAVIGPAGGILAVSDGAFAGLQLGVQAGVLQQPTRIRAVAVPPIGSAAAPVGHGFRFEPEDLQFAAAPAVVILPYRPDYVRGTAPGNVAVQHQNAAVGELRLEPRSVDVGQGFVSCEVRVLGSFQVVQNPIASSILEYMPRSFEHLEYDGDLAIDVVQVVDEPHLAGVPLWRWFFTLAGQEFGYYLVDGVNVPAAALGAFSNTESWQELWTPQLQLIGAPYGPPPLPVTAAVQGFEPYPQSTSEFSGTVTLLQETAWAAPEITMFAPFFDLFRSHIVIDVERTGHASRHQELTLWLARGIGPVVVQIDGDTPHRLLAASMSLR